MTLNNYIQNKLPKRSKSNLSTFWFLLKLSDGPIIWAHKYKNPFTIKLAILYSRTFRFFIFKRLPYLYIRIMKWVFNLSDN